MTGVTRRRLLCEGASWGALALLTGRGVAIAGLPAKSRVILVRDPRVVEGDGRLKAALVQEMLDAAMAALVGEGDPVRAWRQVVSPTDIVGIKSNAWRYLPTPAEVEDALLRRIRDAGVRLEAISVDDRGVRANPVFRHATVLINARPMRTHYWAGLGSCIKNYIPFVPEPSAYHPDGCAALGEIWRLPAVEGKTRLNVLVLLTPLFHGMGPHHFNRAYTWPYGGLVVSRDPVAADAIGAAIIAAKRREFFGEERPIAPPPHHIALADTRYRLGNSRLERIELIRLGENGGALI